MTLEKSLIKFGFDCGVSDVRFDVFCACTKRTKFGNLVCLWCSTESNSNALLMVGTRLFIIFIIFAPFFDFFDIVVVSSDILISADIAIEVTHDNHDSSKNSARIQYLIVDVFVHNSLMFM